jgi:hypothetical protein
VAKDHRATSVGAQAVERIIRNEESMRRLRQYILNNPARRPGDAENPRAR